MDQHADQKLTVADLSAVVYSAGRVFNDLSTSQLDTEKFLRAGSLEGITSQHDRALLEDLRDVSEFIIDRGVQRGRIDAAFVQGVSTRITRSGALRPGEFRTADQSIGVSTRYGGHMPPAMDERDLQRLIDGALEVESPQERALNLFVAIARAQPFEDGNKRTGIFVANALLVRDRTRDFLTVPMGEAGGTDREVVFSDLLARSYRFGEDEGVKIFLREHGFLARPRRRDN